MTLRTRIERMEAAHAAVREAASNPSEMDRVSRLAALLTIEDPEAMRITARARSVYDLVECEPAPPAPVRVVDALEQIEMARKAAADRMTAKLFEEAAAEAAAQRAAEEIAPPPTPATQRAAHSWFSQFETKRNLQ